jgi:hypothetical protein
MKLPNHTEKWKMRTTPFTTQIMRVIKRKMRIQDFILGKIGDHICTNWGIKLKEN